MNMFNRTKRSHKFTFSFSCDGRSVDVDSFGHIEDITDGVKTVCIQDEGVCNAVLISAAKVLQAMGYEKTADDVCAVLRERYQNINN